MINHINDSIERTHRLTGMSRDEIVRRGLVRGEIPLYGFGGLALSGQRCQDWFFPMKTGADEAATAFLSDRR